MLANESVSFSSFKKLYLFFLILFIYLEELKVDCGWGGTYPFSYK